MKKLFSFALLLTFTLLFSPNVFSQESQESPINRGPAGLDYSATGGFRTIPLGLAVSGTVGYGKLLWGEKSSKNEILYGYLRPSFRLQTSGVVTVLDTRLDLAPVAPLIFSLGHNDSFRAADFGKIDCVNNACKGRLARNYFRAQAMIGAQGAFLVGILRYDWVKSSKETLGFYDEAVSILGAVAKDRSRSADLIIGYTFLPNHVVGAMWSSALMRTSGQSHNLYSAFYRMTQGKWDFSAGIGSYRSTLQTSSPTLFVSTTWTGLKSIGL
jgi:hypothetical protein